MILSFMNLGKASFSADDGTKKTIINKNYPNLYVDDGCEITLTQLPYKNISGFISAAIYALLSFALTLYNFLFYTKKTIYKEPSPILISLKLKSVKSTTESILFFEKSQFSRDLASFSKPYFTVGNDITISDTDYFYDKEAVAFYRKKHRIRTNASFAFVYFLALLFLSYGVAEINMTVCYIAVSAIFAALIFHVVSIRSRKREYNAYFSSVLLAVNYMNEKKNLKEYNK